MISTVGATRQATLTGRSESASHRTILTNLDIARPMVMHLAHVCRSTLSVFPRDEVPMLHRTTTARRGAGKHLARHGQSQGLLQMNAYVPKEEIALLRPNTLSHYFKDDAPYVPAPERPRP